MGTLLDCNDTKTRRVWSNNTQTRVATHPSITHFITAPSTAAKRAIRPQCGPVKRARNVFPQVYGV